KLLLGVRHDVAVFTLDVVERGPGYRVVLLVHAEKSSEPDHGEDDAVRRLVEHDVFDLADLLARRILHGSPDHLLRANRRCMAGRGWHCSLLTLVSRAHMVCGHSICDA